jgi:hypothetical protein
MSDEHGLTVTNVDAEGNVRRGSDPYPVGGMSEPCEVPIRVRRLGDLSMQMKQELATAENDIEIIGIYAWVLSPGGIEIDYEHKGTGDHRRFYISLHDLAGAAAKLVMDDWQPGPDTTDTDDEDDEP